MKLLELKPASLNQVEVGFFATNMFAIHRRIAAVKIQIQLMRMKQTLLQVIY